MKQIAFMIRVWSHTGHVSAKVSAMNIKMVPCIPMST